ncbi:hypothetical protein TWF970_000751 [Orbilia oligospora]|uniref:Uncharacterized protein n=1 Tax=Orbilia oligospora TaxID=2813651 RepID=A0A7C8VYH3_ORBOL|nr:hypothetical protein TWF970_000751 [Orbilia oligospora]
MLGWSKSSRTAAALLRIIVLVSFSAAIEFRNVDYAVGWICALPIELAAALAVLDEEHPKLQASQFDNNIYHAGRIGEHNVIIASSGAGTVNAATVANQMRMSFHHLRFGLMVGIGGGIPSSSKDIRLGDVAVSWPSHQYGGVDQYDFGDAVQGGKIIRKSHLNRPPPILMSALRSLDSVHPKKRGARVLDTIKKVQEIDDRFCYPGADADRLFLAEYYHIKGQGSQVSVCETCNECPRCTACDTRKEIKRKSRKFDHPYLHFGTIASGNQIMKDAITRDEIGKVSGAICFEMEAAGLMNDFPCAVIRGIADYADSHKNKDWQPYAALTAAAYAKELLIQIPPEQQKAPGINFNVPLTPSIPKNVDFKGRETILSAMQKHLSEERSFKTARWLALVGPGGIGKTQIAIEYIHRTQTIYSAIFWISAVDENSIHNSFVDIMTQIVENQAAIMWPDSDPDYRKLGRRLGIQAVIDEEGTIDDRPIHAKKIRTAFFNWLRLPGNDKWLLIYDNADDLESFKLKDFFPKPGGGTIIISSRRPEFKRAPYKQIEVDGLDEQDAIGLLASYASLESRDNDAILHTLVELLGYMPLAITLAGSFIGQTRVSVSEYIGYYRRNFTAAQSVKPRFNWDYREDTIANTWEISFAAIRDQDERAAFLLLTLSYLNPKEVAYSLWRSDNSNTESELQVKLPISLLASYSMVKIINSETFTIHPVIHSWARERPSEEERFDIIREALTIVSKAIKGGSIAREGSNWDGKEEARVFSHVEHLRLHLQPIISGFLQHEEKKRGGDFLDIVDIIHELGEFTDRRGKHQEALYWYDHALALKKRFLGEDDLATLHTIHSIGCVFFSMGKYDTALENYRHALLGYQAVLGKYNPFTLNVTQHIAAVYESQGSYSKALDLNQLVLAGFEAAFGSNSVPTMKIVNNMAVVFDSLGEYDEAIQRYRKVLVVYTAKLGDNNPNTLGVWHNIGVTLHKMGQPEEALEHLNHALGGYEAFFGDDSQYTLDTVNCIASVFQRQGSYNESLRYYHRALEGYTRILNDAHPSIYKTLGNMAATYDELEDYETAMELYQKAVTGWKEHLGDYDPSILDIIHAMAGTLYKQGDYIRALELFEEAYFGRNKTLGTFHSSTIDSAHGVKLVTSRLNNKYGVYFESYVESDGSV